MEGTAQGEGGGDRWDEYVPAASPLPRTIRRIIREELQPLIELVAGLRTALMHEHDPGPAAASAAPPHTKDVTQK
jgi:hypothetical protein